MKYLFLLCLFLFTGVIVDAQPKIHYTLGMTDPSSHYFEVRLSVSNLPTGDETVALEMGAWRSGRYVLLDFARGVSEFAVEDPRGNVIPWKKTDKQTWTITKEEITSIIVTYKVYANEFNLRTRGLNDEHGFLDPVAVFMYLREYKDIPLTLAINPHGRWHITTGLEQMEGRPFTYEAPNFEYFADCPIEIGNHKDFEFDVAGKKHVWMMAGDGNYDIDKLIGDTKKIIEENLKFWGRLPYERYIFMLHISPTSGGGTEHLNSTIMGTRPFTFKNERSYRGFLGLVSHEFFHTWNVKQLRPAGITPYDWSKENYSEEWWLAEGGTSYFDEIIMIRAGFSEADDYVNGLGRQIEQDRQRPGNMVQSVTEASFDAWIGYWRGNQNSYNDETSYYGKGKLATLLLDMEILRLSAGERSLQDVMKAMFERFPVFEKGYTVEDLRQISEEFAGGSLEEFFEKYIYGAMAYPWEEAFAVAGLRVTPSEEEPKATIGINMSDRDDGVQVRSVVAGSAAAKAGFDVGDVIVAVDGYKVKTSDIQARIGESKPGDRMTMTLFRNGILRTIDVTLGADSVPSYTVARIDSPSEEQKRVYEKWLGVAWPE
jgi:predicted metalloprotease with PDZ domain